MIMRLTNGLSRLNKYCQIFNTLIFTNTDNNMQSSLKNIIYPLMAKVSFIRTILIFKIFSFSLNISLYFFFLNFSFLKSISENLFLKILTKSPRSSQKSIFSFSQNPLFKYLPKILPKILLDFLNFFYVSADFS